MPIFMVIGWRVLKWNGNIKYTYLQTSIFIYRFLPRFCLAQYGWMNEKFLLSRKLWFKHYYQWLFFTGCPFLSLSPPLLWVLEVHLNGIRGSITIHITESKIHISYFENHDSTLMLVFHYFYMSPLPTLTHLIA